MPPLARASQQGHNVPSACNPGTHHLERIISMLRIQRSVFPVAYIDHRHEGPPRVSDLDDDASRINIIYDRVGERS